MQVGIDPVDWGSGLLLPLRAISSARFRNAEVLTLPLHAARKAISYQLLLTYQLTQKMFK